ncbi:hypothetical protein [Zooshikella ganghwensis]|uniref:Uncharacterized protein n=1 Tax=Zooshikella ganghwensis TaxID=202772 RepID=A0A4P9VJC6_9GAMM|nr:hypothetical protein [Zooshikella ganghwensis]RDH42270.1 hypothetical protein B9G39_01760 [Zooshikella ganghwensis]
MITNYVVLRLNVRSSHVKVFVNGFPFNELETVSGASTLPMNSYLIKGENELQFVFLTSDVIPNSSDKPSGFGVAGSIYLLDPDGNKKNIVEFQLDEEDAEFDEENKQAIAHVSFVQNDYDVSPWRDQFQEIHEDEYDDLKQFVLKINDIVNRGDLDELLKIISLNLQVGPVTHKVSDEEFRKELMNPINEILEKGNIKKKILPEEIILESYMDNRFVVAKIKPNFSKDFNKEYELDLEEDKVIDVVEVKYDEKNRLSIPVSIVKIAGKYFVFLL